MNPSRSMECNTLLNSHTETHAYGHIHVHIVSTLELKAHNHPFRGKGINTANIYPYRYMHVICSPFPKDGTQYGRPFQHVLPDTPFLSVFQNSKTWLCDLHCWLLRLRYSCRARSHDQLTAFIAELGAWINVQSVTFWSTRWLLYS
jgi:hypothetical protein